MSLDRSLKTGSGLIKHRNVLKRAERVAKLAERDRFDMAEGDPLGLPKVANRKVATKSTKKEAKEEQVAEAAPANPES